ncbi:peptide chain release factor-like protein [Pirellulales bacterium]|nr:peptide chain release factor-like protein [Pirellulales bacterium]
MPHPSQTPLAQLLDECQITRTRRRGPGGQHRNKVETAVVIRHTPTGVTGEASERRSQDANRRTAIFRLRVRLALEVRTVAEHAPSALWTQRVQSQRIAVNPTHDDFPALLAECLNTAAAEHYDAPAAAERLGITSSQFVKFLKIERAALALVNTTREKQGKGALK